MNTDNLRIGNYKRILFCTDFSDNSDRAFDFAVDAALRNQGCQLMLLHVMPEPDAQFWKGYIYEAGAIDSRARTAIDTKIETIYQPKVPANVDFSIDICVGDAARTILEYAVDKHCDLIVLGRQGSGAITQWLLGNVTGKVVRRASCPVLVVPMAYIQHSS